MRARAWMMVVGLVLVATQVASAAPGTESKPPSALTLSSSAFQNGQPIPSLYTCDGQNASPALTWSGVPEGTKSLALVAEDPDAPLGTFVHWVVYSIPLAATGLQGGFTTDPHTPDGTQQGTTDFGQTGYGGPCPPSGSHRYIFKLYALDKEPLLDDGATSAQLTQAMQGHILAQAQLMGTYRRQHR